MRCAFQATEQVHSSGRKIAVCARCGAIGLVPLSGDITQLHAGCRLPSPLEGPGAELKKILDSLGAKRTGGCGCEAMIAKMNVWGAECGAHRAEIIEHLRTAYEQLDYGSAAEAMLAGVLAAWSLRLNPLDPLGSLVDEAIRRTSQPSRPL